MKVNTKVLVLWVLAVAVAVTAVMTLPAPATVEAGDGNNASCEGACGQQLGEALAACAAQYPDSSNPKVRFADRICRQRAHQVHQKCIKICKLKDHCKDIKCPK